MLKPYMGREEIVEKTRKSVVVEQSFFHFEDLTSMNCRSRGKF